MAGVNRFEDHVPQGKDQITYDYTSGVISIVMLQRWNKIVIAGHLTRALLLECETIRFNEYETTGIQ